MLRKKLIAALAVTALILFSLSNSLRAQDSTEAKEPALTISGSVDGYYKYDFAKTASNTFTSFTQTHNSFALGMASVKLEHKGEKIGAVADLGFGPRARDFSYTDDGITQAIKQLYVTYSPTDWLTFSLGTWGTHVGYEVLDPQYNRNYSMSYMFTNGPFSHTGFKAAISKDKHSLMLGIANATDYRIPPSDQINKKFFLAQYGLAASDNVSLYVNFVSGQAPDTSKSAQVDAVVTAKLSDKFSIGYNGSYASIKAWDGVKNLDALNWWGSALYLNFDPQPWFGLTLRGEIFSDKDQLKVYSGAPVGGSIFSTTLSANFKKGGFTFIPEIRFDNGSENIFVDKDGSASKSMGNFLFAAIYSF
ncbi:MAG TPA: outer membrane beta-barrel protein [Chitinophagaceae bacterium]|nr:outer membrane beta-barrel protein [Chitinophagaceae bacterium]